MLFRSLRKLREQGLSLSPEADRTTLVRRLYFDLLGLPPTPDEVAEFVHDDDPRAYEALVERLLSSPRYGERWGRHWLDVAGYADSEGAKMKIVSGRRCGAIAIMWCAP